MISILWAEFHSNMLFSIKGFYFSRNCIHMLFICLLFMWQTLYSSNKMRFECGLHNERIHKELHFPSCFFLVPETFQYPSMTGGKHGDDFKAEALPSVAN